MCPKWGSNDIRVYEETSSSVIYTVYTCNCCGCRFGVSYEKCVQYACKYTEQIKMTNDIKELHASIFTGPSGCSKSHLVLDLIEKECNKHFDYIIIICPTL